MKNHDSCKLLLPGEIGYVGDLFFGVKPYDRLWRGPAAMNNTHVREVIDIWPKLINVALYLRKTFTKLGRLYINIYT